MHVLIFFPGQFLCLIMGPSSHLPLRLLQGPTHRWQKKKNPSTTHPTFPRTKTEKRGGNIRSLGSRLLCRPKMRSPAILLLLLLAAAADAIGEFRIQMFFLREIKLRFLNFQIYHAERTRSLTPPLQWTFPSGSTVSFKILQELRCLALSSLHAMQKAKKSHDAARCDSPVFFQLFLLRF